MTSHLPPERWADQRHAPDSSPARPSVKLDNQLVETSLPIVKGDPQKCTQLLYNLVTNACKFTAHGDRSPLDLMRLVLKPSLLGVAPWVQRVISRRLFR